MRWQYSQQVQYGSWSVAHSIKICLCLWCTPFYSPSIKKPAAEDKTTKMSELTLILAMSVWRQSFAEANICTIFSGLGHLPQHTKVANWKKAMLYWEQSNETRVWVYETARKLQENKENCIMYSFIIMVLTGKDEKCIRSFTWKTYGRMSLGRHYIYIRWW